MGVFLSHVDMMPIFYGVIVILGIAVVIVHLCTMQFLAAVLDIVIFITVFKMHGGTMTGGMAAAVAALIGGVMLPPIIKWLLRRRA